MQSKRPSTKTRPVFTVLCTDFDESITVQDTISLLLQLASCAASTQQQLVTQYANEVDNLVKSYEVEWLHTPTTGRRFDDAGLRTFLERYAAIDLCSLERVVKCRALQGIRREEVAIAASAVQIRPNCADTLAAVSEWKVISANWSNELVSSVLIQSSITIGTLKTMQIIANELKVDEQGVTTGEIEMKVQSPMDKAQWIDKVRSMYLDIQPTVIYVGDSANDLLALLEADVGIWLVPDRSSSSSRLLHQLLKHYGIDVHPLSTYSSLTDCIIAASDSSNVRPTIFSMTDWIELKELVGERLQS